MNLDRVKLINMGLLNGHPLLHGHDPYSNLGCPAQTCTKCWLLPHDDNGLGIP